MIDTRNQNTALASALIEELARCGVRRAVLSPGSRSSPIAIALDREPGISLSVVLDERSAGFVALGLGIASGGPAIVACTSGSAAANLHPAVVEADQAGVPLIVLTSDRPPELRGIGAGQTIDQIGLYGSAVRWFSEVGNHQADDAGVLHMRATGGRTYAEAVQGRGPVHLNLSWRDPLGPEEHRYQVTATDPIALDGRSNRRPLTVPIEGREPGDALLDALSEAATRAKRGAIIVGRHLEPDLPEAIAALSRSTGFPILAEPTSQLRFGPHDREAVISAYDLISRARPADLEPDLVFRFGDMPTSKPLRAWIDSLRVDQIVVDPPGHWNDPTRRAGAFVRADALGLAVAVAERTESSDHEWVDRWIAAEAAAQEVVDLILDGAGPLSEPGILRELGGVLAEGDQVLLASSMPVRDAEAFLRGGEAAVRFFSNRGANGIDGTLSTGSGIAAGGVGTWIVLGDLAFAHDLGGLAAIAAADVPIRILVIDNGGGGIFDFLPQAGQLEDDRFERLFTTPSTLDFERAAGLFDIPYAAIESFDDLADLASQPLVVAHARVDRSRNVELHRKLAEAVANALPGE